jgi:hypothetical protein
VQRPLALALANLVLRALPSLTELHGLGKTRNSAQAQEDTGGHPAAAALA